MEWCRRSRETPRLTPLCKSISYNSPCFSGISGILETCTQQLLIHRGHRKQRKAKRRRRSPKYSCEHPEKIESVRMVMQQRMSKAKNRYRRVD